MLEGKRFLPLTGMPMRKIDLQQDEVRGLRAGAVDGGDLNAEVVDDGILRRLLLRVRLGRRAAFGTLPERRVLSP